MLQRSRLLRRARTLHLTLAGATLVLLPDSANAHFVLQAPPAMYQQNGVGDPQKSAPCGQSDPNATAMPSNMITSFKAGETITITINETVTHPGHYRVALAEDDMMDLPADPEVTKGTTACGSAAIMDPPVYPVLADGELVHEKAFSGAQSFMVKLPDDVTCEKCVLQVIEFMSNHGLNNPGGCFYHHCANIKITGDGAGGSGGAGGAGPSKGGSGGVPPSGGSGGTSGSGGSGATAAGAGGRGGGTGGTTGGSAPTGGAPPVSTGGAPTGGTTVAPPLTGGAPATATGGAPATATGGVPAAPPPAASSSDDSGGCSLGAQPRGSTLAAWAAALAGAALIRRRRRR
jgi:MYXO-CTERM domain-containing protein